jgi:hypothetical protein
MGEGAVQKVRKLLALVRTTSEILIDQRGNGVQKAFRMHERALDQYGIDTLENPPYSDSGLSGLIIYFWPVFGRGSRTVSDRKHVMKKPALPIAAELVTLPNGMILLLPGRWSRNSAYSPSSSGNARTVQKR